MSDVFPVAFFGLVAVAVILLMIYAYCSGRKRAEALSALATQMGLKFSVNDPFDIPETYSFCYQFKQGRGRKASNVIYGRANDSDVKTCDYRYETGSSGSSQVHPLSFAILDTPYFFPYMIVRPEVLADRVAALAGAEDIDFESEEFSREFYVNSGDKKFAYDVIHPRMMEFLLSEPRRSIELLGPSVIIYTGRMFQPQEFAQGITFAQQFVELLPEYLQKQLRGVQEAT